METSLDQANTIPLLAIRLFDLSTNSSPLLRQVSCGAKPGKATVLSIPARSRGEAEWLVGFSQNALRDRTLRRNQDLHVRAVLAGPQAQLFCRRSLAKGPAVSF